MKSQTKVTVGQLCYYNGTTGDFQFCTDTDAKVNTVSTSPSDGINPGNKVDPTNWAYTINRRTGYFGRFSYWYNGSNWGLRMGTYSSPWSSAIIPTPGTTLQSLYNEALSKLNDKVRDNADWAEDIAQASRTAKLFKLADNAADLARTLRRNPIAGVSSLYLQFRYGWKPLMQNVYDTAVLQLQDTQAGRVITAGARVSYPSSATIEDGDSGVSGEVVHADIDGLRGVRFKLKIKPQSGPSLSDFTTLNPLYLGWNLIPYSFVVDWFWNVGGYLEAMESAMKYNAIFDGGYYTELDAYDATLRIKDLWSGSPKNSYYYEYAKKYQKHVNFRRVALTSWPLPQFPRPTIDLGGSKLLAAAALLGTILGRKSTRR